MITTGADIIVRTLMEQGVTTVFGYPGGNVINIYDALYEHVGEIRHVLVAHEQGAAHMADGYARATGKVGVCIATSGPGATNLVTGIATAYLDSIPMVAITGNVAMNVIGTDSFQELDITGVTLPITKHNYFVSDVRELADTIREAFELAMSGRPGPVLVDVAKNAQQATCEWDAHPPVRPAYTFAADASEVKRAATIINESKRPLVYFGGGAISSGTEQSIQELAEAIDAPISCSLMGISGIPTDSPRFLGMEGMHGRFASSRAMVNADCIIALGVRFNDRSTGDRKRFGQSARIVHIDVDESELSKTLDDACDLHGDLRLTLGKLLPLVDQRTRSDWALQVQSYREQERRNADTREGLTPRNAMHILQEFLQPETPVVTDVGQHQMWAAQHLHFSLPRTFISSGGLGTMGFGMGAAIGASLATGRHTALVIGDGGFGMCMNELATAVTYKAPVAILLFNNKTLGMVRQQQRFVCDKRYSNTDLDQRHTDYVAIAEAFGAQGERVDSLESLREALARAFASPGPYLVECPIDKDELVLPMMLPGGTMDNLIVKGDE